MFYQTDFGGKRIYLNDYPAECPVCHRTTTPICKIIHVNSKHDLYSLMLCPNPQCESCYAVKYTCINPSSSPASYKFAQIIKGTPRESSFSSTIKTISEGFVKIYNESSVAEQLSLLEIAGIGYRKSIEFLIKDYLILNNPTHKEQIEKKLLGQCIGDHVDNEKIKSVAKRAVWLGNDEAHYVRKWEGKNLEDLKKLIELTVHWIEMESLTKSFEEEMPG